MILVARKCFSCFALGMLLAFCVGDQLWAQRTAIGDNNTLAPAQEVIALKSQIDIMREYDQKLLTTVYWSLTTVAGLALVLVGFSWFTNWRVYERDKVALQEDMEAKLIIRFSALKTEFEGAHATMLKELISRLDGKISSSTKVVEGKFETMASSLKQIETAMEANFKQVNNANTELHLQMQYDVLQAEARYWELKEVPGNELNYYREMLGIALKLGSEIKISTSLARQITLMKSGTLPFWGYVPDIIDALNKLPAKYASQRDAIVELLKGVKGA